MTVSELQGADFIGYDAPPVIVAKPGETITVPLFVSHFSDRKGPRQAALVGRRESTTRPTSSWSAEPESRTIEWTPYDVRQLEPVKARMPMRPFVGAFVLDVARRGRTGGSRPTTSTSSSGPSGPCPGSSVEATARWSSDSPPATFARSQWSGPAASPAGKAHGQGKGFFEYRLILPEAVAKARPEAYELKLEAASKAGRRAGRLAPAGQQARQPPDRRTNLALHARDRDQRPRHRSPAPGDDPADARGVLSHLARVEHGSYGELIESRGALPGPVREELADGKPLVLRLAVPDDAEPAGGLSLFGAESGQYPFDPTLVIRTKDPLPSDLGEDSSARGSGGKAATEEK